MPGQRAPGGIEPRLPPKSPKPKGGRLAYAYGLRESQERKRPDGKRRAELFPHKGGYWF